MKLISWLSYSTALISLAGCHSKTEKSIKDTRPNVILFVADDHGTDALVR